MKRNILSFFIWILGPIFVIVCQTQNEYGPYKTEILSMTTCKGPKRGECGPFDIIKTNEMWKTFRFVSDIQKECLAKTAKLIVKKANHTNVLWNYQANKPCEHFCLGPLLKQAYNLTNNHCKILKGHYEISLNLNELAKKFFGPTFFYDTFDFKAFAYNDVNNLYCLKMKLKISKE